MRSGSESSAVGGVFDTRASGRSPTCSVSTAGPDRLVGRIDLDRPVAVRMTIGGRARRTVDRADPRAGIRGQRSGVERGVFDVVTHPDHAFLTERLGVEKRAAVVEPELAVLVVAHGVRHVHVLMHEPDVELERLHDRGHVVALDAHERAHAVRVDRARTHPQIDGDVVHLVEAAGTQHHLREDGPVHEHPRAHRLVREGECFLAVDLGLRAHYTSRVIGRSVRPSP